MQALFFHFFKKKSFLIHYEQNKKSKKVAVSLLICAVPSSFPPHSTIFRRKKRIENATKKRQKRKQRDIRRAVPVPHRFPTSSRAQSSSLFAGTSVSPRFLLGSSSRHNRFSASRHVRFNLIRPVCRFRDKKKKAGSGSAQSRPAGQAEFELTCRTPGSCRA